MVKINDYIWIFPFIGGIIILIALLTPAAFNYDYGGFYFIWSWGLFIYEDKRPFVDYFGRSNIGIGFSDNFFILTTLITSSVIALSCALVIIISAIKYKKDLNKVRKVFKTWLVPSTILIILSVVIVIWVEYAIIINYEISFWESFIPGFGTIGMFLGASLTIIGFYFSKK